MTAKTAVTVGNFDGVHCGHRALIERARSLVGDAQSGGRVVALAFWPHPITLLRPERTPETLSTFEQRADRLRAAGADAVVRLDPAQGILELDPRRFVDWVVSEHAPSIIVEGPDFHFGASRAGNVDTLRELAREQNIEVDILEPLQVATSDQILVTVSSTMIRWMLSHGRVEDACIMLGASYAVRGEVVTGHRRGRDLGFPTANIRTPTMLPRDGIYAGWANLPDGERKMAAISVGLNPTFGDGVRALEAHILDWDGPNNGSPEYGWPIELSFDHWLRDQITYTGIDALVRQIRADVDRTRDLLGRTKSVHLRASSQRESLV